MNYVDRNINRVEQQREEQGEYLASLHAEGCADAAFGYDPQSIETEYLNGYFKTMRERVEQGETLQVKWRSPQTHFAFGYDDNSHIANYHEEF